MKYLIILLVALVIIFGAVSFYDGGKEARENTDNPITNTNNNQAMNTFSLMSSEFNHGEAIPSQYTCDADNISPPLRIENIPEDTVSLTLIMDDPDIPQEIKDSRGIEVFDHWVLFNIPKDTGEFSEDVSSIGIHGANASGENTYTGPCPPSQYEPTEHRYFFRLFALDTELDLEEGATRADVEQAMEGHILEQTELMGRYEREETSDN